MNLKRVSDQDLLGNVEKLALHETEVLLRVLYHFQEIERRRLYCTLKHGSLFHFAVRHLRYSEDQAQRRIAAMRLLKELPEIESKIGNGQLSLSNLGTAKTLFAKEKKAGREYSRERKLEVLGELAGKSAREAARIVAAILPEVLRHDSIRPIAPDRIELKCSAPAVVEQKIERLKGLLAHSHPLIETGELIDKLCDLGLETWSKTATSRDLSRQRPQSRAGVLRAVFQEQCCGNCGSAYALEEDHVVPRAVGGDSSRENLRALCRKCNQRAAIEYYGINKMENFLKSPSAGYFTPPLEQAIS